MSGFRLVVSGALRPAGGVRCIPGPRSGGQGGLLVEGAVFEHAVDHVATASCEADDGGVVVFALFPFAFVVGDRGRVFDAGDEQDCHSAFLSRLLPPRAGLSPLMLVPDRLVTGAMPA